MPIYVQVLATDFPDPGIKLMDGTYYAFGTNSNSGSSNVSAATSKDLVRAMLRPGCTTVPRDAIASLMQLSALQVPEVPCHVRIC